MPFYPDSIPVETDTAVLQLEAMVIEDDKKESDGKLMSTLEEKKMLQQMRETNNESDPEDGFTDFPVLSTDLSNYIRRLLHEENKRSGRNVDVMFQDLQQWALKEAEKNGRPYELVIKEGVTLASNVAKANHEKKLRRKERRFRALANEPIDRKPKYKPTTDGNLTKSERLEEAKRRQQDARARKQAKARGQTSELVVQEEQDNRGMEFDSDEDDDSFPGWDLSAGTNATPEFDY